MKRVILGLTFALICGFGMRLPQAAAQDDTFSLPILAIQCPTLPGADEYPFDDWQHPCEPAIGLVFTVTDANSGNSLGLCTTVLSPAPEPQPAAYCNVSVELGAEVVVTLDESRVPAGYVPVETSVTVTAPDTAEPDDVPTARFIIVQQSDNGPTTELPSTGSGSSALSSRLIPW
jgi:hypothetical protein